jgi:hypothetical protein
MKEILAIAIIALSAPAAAVARPAPPTAPADVPGWHGTKWGMTVDEAKAALGDEAESVSAEDSAAKGWSAGKDRSWPTRLRIPNYEIAGHAFDVKLVFEADRLRVVSLVPVEKGTVLGGIFVSLESQLVKKYGAPTLQKEVGSTRRILWTLNKTIIEITYFQFGEKGMLILTYTPRLTDDKL